MNDNDVLTVFWCAVGSSAIWCAFPTFSIALGAIVSTLGMALLVYTNSPSRA